MYRDSVELYARLIRYVLMFVGIELANRVLAEWASAGAVTHVVSFFNAAFLCFIVHQAILLPDRRQLSNTNLRLLSGFAAGLLVMFAVGIVPAIVGAVILISQMARLLDEEMTVGLLLMVTMPGILFVALVILPLFGTFLSALVMQDDKRGISAAFARGRKTYFFAASRMIMGPVPVYVIGVAMTLVNLDMLLNTQLSESRQPDLAQILFLCGLFLLQALVIIMGSWVLCHAYLRAQPDQNAAVFD